MANRQFDQFRYSLEKVVRELFASVSFGASGAPTIVAATSKGISSITRTGTGAYTIQLSDKYTRLLAMHATAVIASGAGSTAPSLVVKADSVSSTGQITVVFNAAGTAADPASGEVKLLQILLKDSSV